MKKNYLSSSLLIAGFALWTYGFSYGSFWYANEGPSLLEPVRVWVVQATSHRLYPGSLEQIMGLAAASLGIFMKIFGEREQ